MTPPQRRVLMVCWKSPFPTDSGSKQRTALWLRALTARGEVHLAVLDDAPAGRQDSVPGVRIHWLGRSPEKWARFPRLRQLVEIFFPYKELARQGEGLRMLNAEWRYEAVVFRYLSSYAAVQSACAGIPTVVDVDDLDSQKIRSEGAEPGAGLIRRMLTPLRLRFLRAPMRRLLGEADSVAFCAPSDASEAGVEHPWIVPNLPFDFAMTEIPPVAPSRAQPPVVKFLGRLSWPVNTRALEGFLTHSWPLIRKEVPAAVFQIGGSGLGESHRARWASIPGVVVAGYVTDVAEFYRNASLTVCPIFEGGGTKIKILESLWHGRMAVIAAHSLRGHEGMLGEGIGVCVCHDWREIASRTIGLLKDDDCRGKIESAGRRALLAGLSWDGFVAAVNKTVDAAILRSQRKA